MKEEITMRKIPVIGLILAFSNFIQAVTPDPSASDYTGNKGVAIYVSKQGDNSDGSSWQKAFHTIQAGLSAIPDDQGGHRIIIRPDTYVEANLYTLHKGAAGSYNLIVGDFDGKLGSGATGWVILDCSAPGVAVRTDPANEGNWQIVPSDAPESGFKSVGGWRNFSGPPGTASNLNFDRWIFRRICATGGETAFGIYATGEKGKMPCTLVVEDCIGIGRMAGAYLDGGIGRKDEPIQFRRCHFMNLDRWQNAGGAFIHAQNASMPEQPEVIFEDCTMVSPDNALHAACSNDESLYTRVKLKDCRLIVLNFAQTQFGPDQASSGVIYCNAKDGSQLHVDLDNCRMMGYKLFGARQGDVSYTAIGNNKVYVQFEQTVPRDFERIGPWPREWITDLEIPGFPVAEKRIKTTWPSLSFDPTSPNYTGRKGKTIYVSKLGDNTDGNSWSKAFHTIQAGLSAVPDDEGGHTLVIRPDTYFEGSIVFPHPGAAGAYNTIIGDADGSLGSGAKGWVVIDLGDPQLGFKSCDCWCLPGAVWRMLRKVVEPKYQKILTDKNLTDQQREGVEKTLVTIQNYPDVDLLALGLDRWIYRNLYVTAGNCMFFADQWNKWEGTDRHATPFSTVVENCVGIGQAVGGGAASFLGRPGEPVLYRGCYFMNADWPGDAGAGYVRAHETSMPAYPDAIYEDCTLVSPDNALQTFSPGCDNNYTRVKLKDCRLVVLNFSQPCEKASNVGGWNTLSPSTGIIRCEAFDAKQLHIDFENCFLMGYGVFGTRTGVDPSYSIRGKVQAYTQFQQPTPKGFERLELWPVEALNWLVPPQQPNH
jgi:hypothetical protein